MTTRLTDTERVLRHETEAEFASWVLDALRLHGWRVAHFRPARTLRGWATPVQADGEGFPDLICTRGPRLLAVELKREIGGRLTLDQETWLLALRAAGAETYVWRPSDRERILSLLAKATP